MSIRNYYTVLGIGPGSSLSEIKKAYRRKAKEYHPDINKSPGASERFIEINEAYEFFISHRPEPSETLIRDGDSSSEMSDIFNAWMAKERAKARARAARYARAKYEEFRNSPLYRTSNVLSLWADYVTIIFGVLIMIAPIFGVVHRTRQDGEISPQGVFAAFILLFVGFIIISVSYFDVKRRKRIIRSLKNEKG